MPIISIAGRPYMLELAPWTWKGAKADVYTNVYDDLDTTPVEYHYGAPVDPTEYQNEYIGQVIGIY
eukprot:CAMPEP_0181323780 /NCGR_PEP_ID=MMETSP1101-20121128/19987_1 /TAXON_ID=46948 /ORGANISM="Rhodomonas abbreviata, Strain Caron Lab Isolate" /LENGTH=65 /DNA_ID=CAMNT_0023431869 /DNA_START=105 /DNA_END=302 /DNA_ORIENTATION=+